MRTAQGTPCRNDATRSEHCNCMRQGGCRPRAAAGSRRDGTGHAVAAMAATWAHGKAACSTASSGADPAHAGKSSSWRRAIAMGFPMPGTPGHSYSKHSKWRHLRSLVARVRAAKPRSGHRGEGVMCPANYSHLRLHLQRTRQSPLPLNRMRVFPACLPLADLRCAIPPVRGWSRRMRGGLRGTQAPTAGHTRVDPLCAPGSPRHCPLGEPVPRAHPSGPGLVLQPGLEATDRVRTAATPAASRVLAASENSRAHGGCVTRTNGRRGSAGARLPGRARAMIPAGTGRRRGRRSRGGRGGRDAGGETCRPALCGGVRFATAAHGLGAAPARPSALREAFPADSSLSSCGDG